MVITHTWYVQINTGILEKVIAETLGHKSSKALRCYERTSSVQQKAVTASINNIVSDPVALSCSHVNCFLPNHCHVNTRQGIGKYGTPKQWGWDNRALLRQWNSAPY